MERDAVQWAWAYRGARRTVWFAAAVCAIVLLCAQAARAGTIRQRILSVADQEIGYHDHGYYCTKFGPCETWCSLFVTWVWREAGVPVPSLAFTGYLYDWARHSTYVLGQRGVPEPGDAVLFGSGPWSVETSLHTGVVEAVYPGYLVTIEGDSWHGVRRYVVRLRDPQLVGEPGPIYAYASPLGARGNPGGSMRSAATAFPLFRPRSSRAKSSPLGNRQSSSAYCARSRRCAPSSTCPTAPPAYSSTGPASTHADWSGSASTPKCQCPTPSTPGRRSYAASMTPDTRTQ